MIVVSDGKETCGGDPCAAVRELRAAGIDVRVDVIGFDVGADERAQLVCIAGAGGGRYYDARTPEELRGAVARVAGTNWLEALMDVTTLVAVFGLLAFLVERLTNGIAIVLGYWSWWRLRMEAPAAVDPDTRALVDRNRRAGLFALSAVFAVVGAVLVKLNLLAELNVRGVPPTAGYIVTGLLIAAGADPIREVLKLRDHGREAPASPVQVTGTLLLQQAPPATTSRAETPPES